MANMPPMPSFSELFRALWTRLGSMSLAVVLLTVLSIASAIGTVLLQNQDQADYLQQFGPLWYWVFRSLGLFDMYHTWWFLTLLGLLMVSLAACLWRHVPLMLKEMRSRKATMPERSLKRFKNLHHWQLKKAPSVEALQKAFKSYLPGWEFEAAEENGLHFIRADKGRYNKWGYITVHSAILLILIGGLISVLFGIRGNMSVAEGGKANSIFFLEGTETAKLELPFEVRCNSFDIDFFPTGAPKEFRSNLTIIDNGKEMLTSNIIVNEPLYYKGMRIYQASFGDAGSEVAFDLFHLDGSEKIGQAKLKVYDSWEDPETGVSLKITDFKEFNVENMADIGQPAKFQDIGPAVVFELRGPGLQPVKVKSFMEPFVDLEGKNQGSFMLVSMSGNDADYQSVGLGLDLTNPVEWKLYHNFLKELKKLGNRKSENDNLEAFKRAMKETFGDELPENFEAVAMRAVNAVNMLSRIPWPILPILTDHKKHYYTGLQVAQDPGMNVVWVGSAILVIGLCFMFYMPHRKVWLVVAPADNGKTKISLAGMTAQNKLAFEREFHNLFIKLDKDVSG